MNLNIVYINVFYMSIAAQESSNIVPDCQLVKRPPDTFRAGGIFLDFSVDELGHVELADDNPAHDMATFEHRGCSLRPVIVVQGFEVTEIDRHT